MNEILVGLLFVIGIGGTILKPNLLYKIISLSIAHSSVIILFLLLGARAGSEAPILTDGARKIVDPTVQALMLTAIVVGVCVTALALVLAVRLYRIYGTLDLGEIEKRIAEEEQ